MEASIGIVVGIDIAKDYTQVSYFTSGMSEPDSMSTIHNEQKYLIPTVLFKWQDREEWLLGDEAMLRAGRHEGTAIDDLLTSVLMDKTQNIGGVDYSAKEIFEIYIDLLFKQIYRGCNCQSLEGVCVTIEFPDRLLMDTIYDAVKKQGLRENQIRVIGHSEALLYYIINQNKEIWVNEVAMFDFTKNHFVYRRVSQNRSKTPNILRVDEFDFTEDFPYEELKSEEGRRLADERLLQMVDKEFRSHIVSAVFLTGLGFYEEEWIEKALPVLCNKRRVFKGYNLYVKGACYSIMEKLGRVAKKDYLFYCTGRTMVNINVMVKHGEGELPLCLSEAGVNWYEAGAIVDCILDDTNEVKLQVSNPFTKTQREVCLDLSDFPKRPNKTTRVEITVAYRNDDQCIVQVKDKGFGEFFPGTNQTVRRTMMIQDMI